MRLYLAGPLFNEAERRFNVELTAHLEDLGYHVFLPQRDGVEGDLEPYAAMPPDDRRAARFARDRDAILGCDVFLFVTDGRVPDEGAAVELGIAYADRAASGRPRLLIGLRTDVRTTFASAALNPMIGQALDVVVGSIDELVEVVRRHRDRARWGGAGAVRRGRGRR